MGSHVAVTVFPFQHRLGEGAAVRSGGKLNRAVAAVALLNYFVAGSTVVGTPLGSHERTFRTVPYG